MKVENWLVVACIVLGLSIALNVYLYTNDKSDSDVELQIMLDRSNRSLDSIAIEKDRVDSLLTLKPIQYTIIKNRYVKIHDTIDMLGNVWNDSLCTANIKEYNNTREKYSVSRFPDN